MNVKRFVLASLAVFVAVAILDFLINNFLLMSAYESLKNLWRPDMMSKIWVMYVVGLITSFLLAYIFIKGYEGKGIMEGVRFGILIGLFTGLPMAFGTYIMIPIPLSLALEWFIVSLVEMLVAGMLLAAIYKPAGA